MTARATPSGKKRGPALSLKGRALQYLARREHSRLELQRKLAAHAESAQQLESALDALEAAGLLSNPRFAESLVHRRAAGFGAALIRHELRSHALDPALIDAQIAALNDTEAVRARAVWKRRFGAPAEIPQERTKQIRFLLARGFRAEVVYKVVGARDPEFGAPDFDVEQG
jgi:regulatory protein